MNILNMYMLQCILCASEQTFVWIYGTLQIKIIIIKFYECCAINETSQPQYKTERTQAEKEGDEFFERESEKNRRG